MVPIRASGLAAALLALLASAPAAAAVFINEIHYDNVDTDVAEAIEVVATTGESLSDYQLVPYNGSDGTEISQASIPAGQQVACGASVRLAVVDFAVNGLQNGAPDGVALVGPGNSLVQFLSWEGSFSGSLGAAAGAQSTDIGVSESSSTPVGHSLQLAGSGSASGDFTWQAAAADSFGACNTGQDFGAAVDLPPEVVATSPADAATGVEPGVEIAIDFSETVAIDNAAGITLDCGVGTPAFSASVGGATLTIAPGAALPESAACSVGLAVDAVHDLDDNRDPLAAPFAFGFTTGQDLPPVVLSTVPTDGADDFPSAGDLVVLFSEAVTLSPGAFSLDCDQTTGIVLSHDASGASFTVDTGTALVGGETCTFSITASAVEDASGQHPATDTVVMFSVRESSAGSYYDQVNTGSAGQLRCTLHQTIRSHTEYPYGWTELELADQDPNDPARILDVYRNCSYASGPSGDRVGGSGGGATCNGISGLRYNREHVWPKSLGFSSSSLAAHNDQHMLHLSDEDFNSHRGNKPYDYCPKDSGCNEDRTITYNGDTGGDGSYPGNSNWYTSTDGSSGSYEVWHRQRGDMARAVFYMAIRYEGGDNLPDLELTDNRNLIVQTSSSAPTAWMGILGTLLEWHAQDPVDARELDRNQVVFSFQGNRNPFIDHPEWATRELFESSTPAECVPGNANTAPEAFDDAYATSEDAQRVVGAAAGVLDNDSDADADPLLALLLADAQHGSLLLADDGGFSYLPDADYCGSDTFSYRADDGQASSAAALVTIAVACVNDAPVVVATLPDRLATEDEAIAAFATAFAFAFADVDDGDVLGYAISGQPPGLVIDAATGEVSGTPQAGSAGSSPWSVTVTADDGQGGNVQAGFEIQVQALDVEPGPGPLLSDGFEG